MNMDLNDVDMMVGEEPKTEPVDENVIDGGQFILLMVGAVIFIGGMLGAFAIQNYFGEPVVQDLNVTQEHIALAQLEINDANVLFQELQIVKQGLIGLQVQHLCGVNDFVSDSNRVIQNEQGSFVTYSCFARAE